MDFAPSTAARQTLERLTPFMNEHVFPAEAEYHRQLGHSGGDWRRWRQPAIMESLKQKARAAGLWNLFLPGTAHGGAGLSNADYAPLAEVMGRSFIAPEVFNCNAPDTGNMEVLAQYGTPAQQDAWLHQLLDGTIRSAFCMTEPDVASSDATNMAATAIVEGDQVVLNGVKWWSTGLGHPNCRLLIFMGVTDPNADKHQRHSMVLVPIDASGVEIGRMLPVFGGFDEPSGHGEVSFRNARVPRENILLGAGRGFEIAQGRLGPGRIHHCMRALGAAERALELMCQRAIGRVAFGQPLARLGGNNDRIANARMAIEQARLLTLKAAWMMDTVGAKGAMSEISQIKVVVPQVACDVIDEAIQMYGGAGVSDDFPLASLYAYARVLRIVDGPDAVHRALVGKLELRKHLKAAVKPSPLLDAAGAVREGESLNGEAIAAFLQREVGGLSGQPAIAQFPGGASNLTYLLKYPERELVLRRPPFGHKAKSAHDVGREARIMASLKPVYPCVPAVVATCSDPAVLGCDFYVMERIAGVIPRRDLPAELNLDAAATRQLCLNVIDKLIELHLVDWRAAKLESVGKGEGYVQRQIDGWTDRYRKAKTPDVGDCERVIAWLHQKLPAQDIATCVIHNDFRLDNVVLNPTKPLEIIGVLDWEMATLGDPLMDLGNSLAYWVQADDDPIFQKTRRQPTNAPGMLTRAEVIEYYATKTGHRVDNFDFYSVYGLFRLVVIVQQIYYRFFHGQTKNPEFAGFGLMSKYLEQRCLAFIDKSKL